MTGAMLAVLLAAGTVAEMSAPAPVPDTATNAVETVVIRTARLRNPFWPIDYLDGEYEAISDGSEAAESSLAVAAAEAEAAERMARRAGVAVNDDAQTQENRWRKASRLVKVSGVTSAGRIPLIFSIVFSFRFFQTVIFFRISKNAGNDLLTASAPRTVTGIPCEKASTAAAMAIR